MSGKEISWKNLFLPYFSYRSIECKRLITKNWILALPNAFFRSKNMKNLKGLAFSKASKKKKVENFTHFEKVVFFEKNDIRRVFRIFDRKESFAKAKK